MFEKKYLPTVIIMVFNYNKYVYLLPTKICLVHFYNLYFKLTTQKYKYDVQIIGKSNIQINSYCKIE